MNELSDKELQTELQKLTGKPVGPVLPSTRPLLVKRLLKLRTEREKAVFAFSSDEEDSTTQTKTDKSSTSPSTRTPRKSTTFKKPTPYSEPVNAASPIKHKSPSRKGAQAVDGDMTADFSNSVDTLTNDELTQKLHEVTGIRYPISDSTRSVLLKKLKKQLEAKQTASQPISATADSTVEPMDTQFSDDDIIDFEPDPDMSAIRVPTATVDQSVNTSSYLDISVPDYSDGTNPNNMPDIVEIESSYIRQPIAPDAPAPSFNPPKRSTPYADKPVPQGATRRSVGAPARPELEEITSPDLPVRPVTTRRSQPTACPTPMYSNRPAPPTPPRSAYARRPLGATFRTLSTEVTPKPSSRFSLNLGEAREKLVLEDSRRFQSIYKTQHSTGTSIPADSRLMKINKDRDMSHREKGRSWAQLLPSYLLQGLVLLLLALMVSYFYIWMNREPPLDALLGPEDRVKQFICHESDTSSLCYLQSDVRQALGVRDRLLTLLSRHAGFFECHRDGYEERRAVKAEIRHKIVTEYIEGVGSKLWELTMKLIISNPHWGIMLYGEIDAFKVSQPEQIWYLESVTSTQPISCIIHLYTVYLVYSALALLSVAGLGYLAYLYGKYRKMMNEDRKSQLFDLVENVIDVLEGQFARSRDAGSGEKPYVAINHARDMLIQPADRLRKSSLWDEAVNFIRENETRVREEVQQVAGEEYKVWRWLQSDPLTTPQQTAAHGRGWQGSVFLDDSSKQKLRFRPTPCIKIRNMFDKYSEDGTSWPTLVEHALFDKLHENHGVIHIHVDRESEENRVYMKFSTEKQSGKAFTSLNGSYYNGRCVQVKFLMPDKYHQRFPESKNLTQPIN